MAVWILWLIVSGVLIVVEIFTMSFYLLLAGIGAAIAGAFAFFGFNIAVQLIVASTVTLLGWLLVAKYKPHFPDARSNPNLNMDIGATVQLASVLPDGKLTVQLRGAKWDARIEGDQAPQLGTDYIITKIEGSILILKPKTGE